MLKVTNSQIYIRVTATTGDPKELYQKLNSGNWIAFGMEQVEGEPVRLLLGQLYPEGFAPVADLERESLWYMTAALEDHFWGKSRREKKVARKIVQVLRKLLALEPPQGGGTVGLYSGWAEAIQSASNQRS